MRGYPGINGLVEGAGCSFSDKGKRPSMLSTVAGGAKGVLIWRLNDSVQDQLIGRPSLRKKKKRN